MYLHLREQVVEKGLQVPLPPLLDKELDIQTPRPATLAVYIPLIPFPSYIPQLQPPVLLQQMAHHQAAQQALAVPPAAPEATDKL